MNSRNSITTPDYTQYNHLSVPKGQEKRTCIHALSNKKTWVIVVVTILLLATSAAMLLFLPSSFTRQIDGDGEEDWNYCGRSSHEAMRRGCVMEPLFYGWMPKQCVFQELSDQFPVFEDRKWYLDTGLEEVAEPSLLWSGGKKYVYTRHYHDEHCLFQWRKIMFAIENNKPYVDNKTISIHHTKHCSDQLTVAKEPANGYSEVELGFYRCRKTNFGGVI